MPFKFIQVDASDGILTLTINRPEVLNALHFDAHAELSGAIDDFAADPSLRVAIITGVGERSFCVGTDLKSLALTGPYDYPRGGFGGVTTRLDLWKPVIAAVNGLCMGGGAEIVAACDLAVACEHAEFALSEPLVGLAALGGGALQRLARGMAMKDAMYLALTAQRISAVEARRVGLINQVAPRGESLAQARVLAAQIVACAPLAIEASKQVLLQSLEHAGLAAALDAHYPAAQRMLASRDAVEGPLAFSQKRAPHWIGS